MTTPTIMGAKRHGIPIWANIFKLKSNRIGQGSPDNIITIEEIFALSVGVFKAWNAKRRLACTRIASTGGAADLGVLDLVDAITEERAAPAHECTGQANIYHSQN